jgi:hypothetical protein
MDPAKLNQLVQHLGTAEGLLDQYGEIPGRVEDTHEVPQFDAMKGEARSVWEGIWEQLKEAAELARADGRDLAAYDAARARAGDIFLADFRYQVVTRVNDPANRNFADWVQPDSEPANAALRALSAAVPEAATALDANRAPHHIELRTGTWWVKWTPVLVFVGILVAMLITELTKKR